MSCLLAFCISGFADVYADSKTQEQRDPFKPLWEVGIGGFAGSLPDYPAAGQNTERALALPYLIYRGDFWRVGDEESRGGISGRFIRKERFELDVTLSAAFPVDSSSNNDRRDMPDLDFLFGIGPQFIVKFVNEPDRKLNLNLNARAVYSTDFSSIGQEGFVFNPEVYYRREHVTPLNLNISTRAGPVFATEKLMDYFYQVDPKFATPSRPAFDADSGYLGTDVSVVVSRRFNKRFILVLGSRLGIHSGATNDDSPLFKDDYDLSVFTAFAWSFAQSKEPAY